MMVVATFMVIDLKNCLMMHIEVGVPGVLESTNHLIINHQYQERLDG